MRELPQKARLQETLLSTHRLSESYKKEEKTLTEKEYRSHPAISRSELWRMNESPEKFKWFKDHPPAPTESLLFGQYIHALLLEPDKAAEDFRIMPELNLRTKEGRAVRDSLIDDCAERGITLVPAEMAAQAKEMVEKCHSDQEVMSLLDGAHEQEFFWTDELTGEECKCRVDCLTEIDGEPVIVDYKSTNNADTFHFVRDMYKYGYHFQSAMYGEGVRINLGLPKLPRFIFIAQEKKPPYAINRVEVTEDVIQLGYDKFREFIGTYHDCKEADTWFGYNGIYNETNEAYLLEWVKDGDDAE